MAGIAFDNGNGGTGRVYALYHHGGVSAGYSSNLASFGTWEAAP